MAEKKESKKTEKKNALTKVKKENKDKTITGFTYLTEIILVYLIPFLGFVFSFMDTSKCSKKSVFVYNQAGAAFMVELALVFLGFIPVIRLFFYVVHIVLYIFLIIALIKETQGVQFRIPFISDFAGVIWSEKEEK